MLLLLLSSAIVYSSTPASTPSASTTPVERCRAAIARKAQGEVSTLTMTGSTRKGATTTVRGVATVLVGMGEPGPERAKAHHLIRQQFTYACTVRGKSVRKLTLSNAD